MPGALSEVRIHAFLVSRLPPSLPPSSPFYYCTESVYAQVHRKNDPPRSLFKVTAPAPRRLSLSVRGWLLDFRWKEERRSTAFIYRPTHLFMPLLSLYEYRHQLLQDQGRALWLHKRREECGGTFVAWSVLVLWSIEFKTLPPSLPLSLPPSLPPFLPDLHRPELRLHQREHQDLHG